MHKKNSAIALDDIKDKYKVAYPVQIATYLYHLAHTSSVLQSNFNGIMAWSKELRAQVTSESLKSSVSSYTLKKTKQFDAVSPQKTRRLATTVLLKHNVASKHLLVLEWSLSKGAWETYCLRIFTPLIKRAWHALHLCATPLLLAIILVRANAYSQALATLRLAVPYNWTNHPCINIIMFRIFAL